MVKKTTTEEEQSNKQPELNVGCIGHVDHGKSSLVEALSGTFPDTHSEELRRGISIRLGYAVAEFRECEGDCPAPDRYTTSKKCACGGPTRHLRSVAFVDAPGHEILMATMLSGAAIMDGSILVIAANEKVPMPQTREHLAAMQITGMKNIIVAQNKIELVEEEEAVENHNAIKEFLAGNYEEELPIVPISAIHKANIDLLIQTIEENVPTPERDESVPARMLVARSFDINLPGQFPEKWNGGVVGGSITQGRFSVGDEVELSPGISRKGKWSPIRTKIVSLRSGFGKLDTAVPGGLTGIGTLLDPALTKNDRLVGQNIGEPGSLPPIWSQLELETSLLDRVVGTEGQIQVKEIQAGENLMLNIGTAKTVGRVSGRASKTSFNVDLRIPICAEEQNRAAISRQIDRRWRLIGYGTISGGKIQN